LLTKRFAKWWLPDYVVFINEIPRTSAGKFLKRKLKDDVLKYIDAEKLAEENK